MAKKWKITVAAALAAVMAVLALAGCAQPKKEQGKVILASPRDGETVPILGGPVYQFISEYDGDATLADRLYTGTDVYQPAPVKVSWTCGAEADYYIVGVSASKEIELGDGQSDFYTSFVTSAELCDLFAGTTYYYRVFAVKGSEVLASVPYSFKTEEKWRTVTVDGVSNTRDLGGKKAAGGKRVKQGIVYRGAAVDSVTKKGKADFLEKLGIKCEIDLRTGTEISVFNKDVNVVSVKAPMYVGNDMSIEIAEYQPELAKEIKAFADPDNYPIYFHCAIGRDRTGTLACLIQLVLGVSEEDIIEDYLLSFFSYSGSADGAYPSQHVNNIKNLINYIRNYGKGSLVANTEAFFKDIGVTAEEIKAIRANMLED